MAKGIYVGVDVLWTEITNKTEYVANDGTRLTANGAFSSTQAYKACDGDASTYWSGGLELETWLKIEFPTAQKITKMNTYINSGDYPDSFSSVTIQGSNNDSTWTNLHTITSPQTELTEIVLNNATSYKYYRIYAVAINTSSARHVNVIEWQIPEYKGIVKSGKARKVTKVYVGVSDKARKVKKGYIGVGGVARPFFSAEQKLEYYGTATSLTNKVYALAATNVGNYALFAGGYEEEKDVDAYNKKLTKSTATALSEARSYLAATNVGNYALFGGGYDGSGRSDVVDAYSNTLVHSAPRVLSRNRQRLAATTIGDYAIFAGGYWNGACSDADAYSSSLVKTTISSLNQASDDYLAAASVGDYAIFSAGTMTSYTSTLVKGTPASLSKTRKGLAATSIGNYALFGGGASTATVDVYSSSLVKTTATNLSAMRQYLTAVSVGDYAIFAGGINSSTFNAKTDTYTKELVKGTSTNLSVARSRLASAYVGNYALFGGGIITDDGYTDSERTSVVDVYQVV